MRGIMRAGIVVGLFTAGCAAPAAAPLRPPSVDISGNWTGTWSGYGINHISRQEPATAHFVQDGPTGHGRLTLENTAASESVPRTLRLPGLTGAPVRLTVAGREVMLVHEIDDSNFTVFMKVDGDRMEGTLEAADPPVHLVLERVKPPAPPAPKAMAPPPPPPAPAPPAVVQAPPAPAPVVVAAAPERPAPSTFTTTAELHTVHFDFDKSDIRSGERKILDGNAEWMQANRSTHVMVEGHADERGTTEYNLALGERRARAARDYLVSRGVDAGRITVLSYGEDRPACTQHAESCWSQNRRVEFRSKPE